MVMPEPESKDFEVEVMRECLALVYKLPTDARIRAVKWLYDRTHEDLLPTSGKANART